MSLFKKLMEGYEPEESTPRPFNSTPQKNGSLFRDLMSTARPIRIIHPTLDTRGKQVEESGWDTAMDYAKYLPGLAISARTSGQTGAPIVSSILGAIPETASNLIDGLAEQFPENSWRRELLDAISSPVRSAADALTNYGKENFGGIAPEDKVTREYISALTGGFGGLADMIHAGKAAEALNKIAQETAVQDNERPEEGFNLNYFANGLPIDLAQLSGSMTSILPFMYAMPEAVALRGAAALGGDALTEFLTQKGATGLAKYIAKSYPEMFRYAVTSVPVESGMEGGEARRDFLNKGFSDAEATQHALNVAGKNMPLLLGSNLVEGATLFSPLLKGSKLPQIAGRSVLNSLQQQIEEGTQQGIQNAEQGLPYSYNPFEWAPNQEEAARRVKYAAGILGGAGGAIQALGGRDENEENWTQGNPEKISAEDFSTRAQKQNKKTQYENLRSWAKEISGGVMSDEVFNSIVRNAKANGVPVKLALAQATAESNGDQKVVSSAGAIGVMQLMPDTAQELGVDPNDTEQNIRGGMKYLKQQYEKYGDWNLALAAYNAGPGNVTDHVPQNGETEHYVDRINKWARMNEWLDDSPIYEPDKNTRSKGVNYLGENGKAEGKYWVRNEGVSFEGSQPDLMNALDLLGKYFYERTGKKLVATAGTNGAHPSNGSEHGHDAGWKVDIADAGANGVGIKEDGALFTSNFEKQPFLDEFIAYGRSLGLGMNLEDLGTSNVHIDVALDGTQWDGAFDSNADGFNLDKVRKNALRTDSSQQQRQDTTPTEQTEVEDPQKPPFDINSEDEQTQKLFEKFARERYTKAINDKDADTAKFFVDNMLFNANDNFINTAGNRDAIRKKYGDELTKWALAQTEQATPVQAIPKQRQAQAEQNQENSFLADQSLTNAIDKLREQAVQGNNSALLTRINAAYNNPAELRNILKENGIAVPNAEQVSSQVQPKLENVVKKNKSPENVLTQSQSDINRIKVASAPIAKGKGTAKQNKRKIQGNAIIELASQNNIQIPPVDVIALQNGSTVKLTEWQGKLARVGAFNLTSQENKPPKSGMVERKDENGTTIFSPADRVNRPPSLNSRAQAIIQQHQKNQLLEREADLANEDDELTEIPNVIPQDNSSYDERNRREDDYILHLEDKQGRFEEQERQRKAWAQWEAKRDKEVAELEARKAEAKRLADETRRLAKIHEEYIKSGGLLRDMMEDKEEEDLRQARLRDEERRDSESAQRLMTPEEIRRNYRNAHEKALEREYEGVFDDLYYKEVAESDAREEEDLKQARLRDEERLDSESAQRLMTPEEIRRNYRNAQRLGDAGAEEKRNLLADQGRKLRDLEIEQLKSKSRNAKIATGKEILRTLRSPQYQATNAKVESIKGLKTALQNGSIEAIRQVRDFIAEADKNTRETKTEQASATPVDKKIIPSREPERKDAKKNEVAVEEEPAFTPAKEEPAFTLNTDELTEEQSRAKEFVGDSDEIITGSRHPLKIRYKIVESSALKPSHELDPANNSVFANPEYPKQINGVKIQPRDRTRPDMQAQLIKMGNNLEPKDLMSARAVNQGAPVVMNDGVVLNGNGRTAAIVYAYAIGKADHYKRALIDNAKKFGLNAQDIAKMNQPILARAVENELSSEVLQDLVADDTGGAQMNASEKTISDKDKLSLEDLNDIAQDALPDPTTKAGRHQYIDILRKIATPNEAVGYVNAEGKVSINGIQRAQNAILALAYGDDKGTIIELTTSPDNNVKNITNALGNSAIAMSKLRLLMKKKLAHSYNLDFISEAVAKLSALRAEHKPVNEFLKEFSFLAQPFSDEAREVLRFFDSHKRDSTKISDFLNLLVQNIQAQGNPSDKPLFDNLDSEPAPIMALIKSAAEDAEATQKEKEAKPDDFAMPSFFSREGDVDTTISNFVNDDNLSTPQKILKSFGKKLGVKTVFFSNPEARFHGTFKNGTVYLNVNSNMPLGKVFWHEVSHWLEAGNKKLYQQLVKAAGITDKQRQAYLQSTGRNDLHSNSEIDSEMLADAFQDTAKMTGLLQNIAGKNRGLVERIIQWLQNTMRRFIEHFRNPQGKLTTKQATRLADEFGKIARNLTDADGNNIFRYNFRTQNIELADGRAFSPLDSTVSDVKLDTTSKFSIGAADNSSDSLSRKIRNKLSAFVSNSKSNAPRNKRITETIQKITGHRILFNSVKDADGTIIDDFNQIIKTPHAYEWETLLPQIGGKFAQSLGLQPTEKMSNYIADWLLNGALNNTTAESGKFREAMQNNPALAELFQLVRKDFQEYSSLPSWEKIGETIRRPFRRKSLTEFLGDIRHNFQEQFTDDLHPIYRMLEEMKKTVPHDVAKLIDESINVYKKARLVRGKGAIANMMIDGSREDIEKIRTALQDQYPDMYFDRLKSIRMILEDAGLFDKNWDKAAREKRLNEFESYCVAKLDKEIHEKNRAGDTEVKPQFKESDDDATIAKFEKEFGQAQKDLVTFSNILLTMQFKAGLISFDQYSKTLKSWKNYIPMARVFDENEEFNFINSFKPKSGSKRDTWSPLAKIIYNTQEFIAQAERNKVKLELADMIRCGGYGEFAAEVERGNSRIGNIVSFKENGETKKLNVYDLAVARAFDSIQGKEESTWIMKALRASSRLLRAMYTVSNPDYAAGNIFRDMADAFIHNKNLSSNPVVALMEVWRAGMTEIFSRSKTQDFYDWLASGGSQSGFVSEGLDYAQMEIDDLLKGGRKERYLSKSFFSQAIDDINKLSELSEYATRRTTFKSSLNSLAANRSDGKPTVQDKANAALESRNASIDFAKGGRSMKQINKVVLFSNAAVQSWALWGKAFKDARKTPEARKALAGKVFRAVAQGVFLSVLQALVNHSDDDRRKAYQQANDWERDTYWIFGALKMPKGVDVGIRLMSALTEEALDKVVADDPLEWRRIGKAFSDALPSLTATIFTPLIETGLNSSWFRDAPIVPYVEQKLPARLQYGAETTGIAKGLADNPIGRAFNFSPRKIDYLINGYLGFMGRFFSRVPDYASGRRSLSFDEAPIIRRFVFSPFKNPKIVKDFYNSYNEQEELYSGYKFERDKGKNVDLPADYDPALHKRLKATLEPMRVISKKEKIILDNPNLDSAQRTEKLRLLEQKRIALCEKVFKHAR